MHARCTAADLQSFVGRDAGRTHQASLDRGAARYGELQLSCRPLLVLVEEGIGSQSIPDTNRTRGVAPEFSCQIRCVAHLRQEILELVGEGVVT